MALIRILRGCCAAPHGVVYPPAEVDVREGVASRLCNSNHAERVMVRADAREGASPPQPEAAVEREAPERAVRKGAKARSEKAAEEKD